MITIAASRSALFMRASGFEPLLSVQLSSIIEVTTGPYILAISRAAWSMQSKILPAARIPNVGTAYAIIAAP